MLGSEELTYRRFKTLLSRLPRESWYVQERYGERMLWGSTEHLLANAVDVLTMLNHNFIQSKNKRKLKPPRPMARPGIEVGLAPGEKKLTGRAVPLAKLKRLAAQWRGTDPEGGDDGRS